MNQLSTYVDDLVSRIRDNAAAQAFPVGYNTCLLAAAALVEEAGARLVDHEPGNRVAELMLLSARIEYLMKDADGL